MIVGVDEVITSCPINDLSGDLGGHFKNVLMVAGACAGLEWIDQELIVPFLLDHIPCSMVNCFCVVIIRQVQQAVDLTRCLFDPRR